MSTRLQYKKKTVAIKTDTFRTLSFMAANNGTNLKKLIEELLDKVAEDFDDNTAYARLLNNVPDGKKPASEEEKAEFENWLGI